MTNEKRLIDANEYCRELYRERDYPGRTQEFMDAIEVAIADLCDMPTVDTVEAEHGRWVFGTANHREYMKCSECLHSYTPDGTFCYCPNCGAKMDGDGDDG